MNSASEDELVEEKIKSKKRKIYIDTATQQEYVIVNAETGETAWLKDVEDTFKTVTES